MPTVDLAMQKELKRRSIIFVIITLIMTGITIYIQLYSALLFGFSLYWMVPLILVSSALSVLGVSFVVTQFIGLYVALRPVEKDPFNPINKAIDLKEDTRIAVMMPIYHEDARRVAGAFSAMIEELSHYKEAKHFEWFILSDSRKEDVIVQEQKAVFLLKEKFPDVGIHYRHRIMNTFAKVGNTSDFFRRWGGEFKAVVLLDADSIVPAETIVTLARTMEGDENIGIIQAMPYMVQANALFGKMWSFGTNTTFSLGFSTSYYLRMGRAPFFGHNVILRTEAIVKHCNLPILPKYGPFSGGKPMSHDFVEAMLLISAGYQVWILPTLPSFEDQLHNFKDYMIREKRWVQGAMDWFQVLRLKVFSPFARLALFTYAMNYFLTVVGLIFFITTYFGVYYMVTHPLITAEVMKYCTFALTVSFGLFVFTLLTSVVLPIIILWKTYRTRISIFKTFFSQLLVMIVMGSFLSTCKMILINRIIWDFFKGKDSIVWTTQDRKARVLSWDECVKFLWPVSVLGLGVAYFFLFYIVPNMTPTVERLIGISLTGVLCFFGLPIVALVFAPVVTRFMSRSFPLIDKMGWFKHHFEGENEYPVVRETRNRTAWFEDQVSETYSFEQALSDPYFALRHLAQCPSRPQKYAFWKDKLAMRNIQDLTRLEKLVVFRCRELWEMFMTKNFHVSKEKTQ